MASHIVFAAYKPHTGKERALMELIRKHVPTLRELELITERPALTIKAKDGTYIEIIEWLNVQAAEKAHEHPAIAKIWEQMAVISDFIPMSHLEESSQSFSHYEVVTV